MLKKIEFIIAREVTSSDDAYKKEESPPGCELVINGKKNPHRIEGCCLEAAFQSDIGYLVFLTNDCPFEEGLNIHLLDFSGKPLDRASIFWMYSTGIFKEWKIEQPDKLTFRFFGDHLWVVQVLPKPEHRLPFFSEPTGVWRSFGFKRHFKITQF